MRTGHLFAGAGGGLLADLILGHEPVFAVEWDAYCSQILRERAAEGWFPGLRVHEGDVRMFDPSEYAGSVDCIHAGFPCQDISAAGNQAGVGEGTRSGLYREVLRIADVVRPQYLFLENVAAILSNGLGTVLGDLAARGYDCRWTCVRASDCGAPHQRDRWWCLAYREVERSPDRNAGTLQGRAEHGRPSVQSERCGGTVDVAVANRTGLEKHGLLDSVLSERSGAPAAGHQQEESGDDVRDSDQHSKPVVPVDVEASWLRGDVADADRSGLAQRFLYAGNEGGEGRAPERQTAAVGGWWESEPDVGRVANGVASRMDRLKALGNGQVPLQAALAWQILNA